MSTYGKQKDTTYSSVFQKIHPPYKWGGILFMVS